MSSMDKLCQEKDKHRLYNLPAQKAPKKSQSKESQLSSKSRPLSIMTLGCCLSKSTDSGCFLPFFNSKLRKTLLLYLHGHVYPDGPHQVVYGGPKKSKGLFSRTYEKKTLPRNKSGLRGRQSWTRRPHLRVRETGGL